MLRDPQMEVATMIKDQIGSSSLYMIGAKYVSLVRKDMGGLSFRTMKTPSGKANHVEVVLNGMDLYDITFSRIWGHKVKVIKKFENIYAENLLELIEENTGLYTHL